MLLYTCLTLQNISLEPHDCGFWLGKFKKKGKLYLAHFCLRYLKLLNYLQDANTTSCGRISHSWCCV
jgi:hypothetical protein